jgi:hypothetical protein
MHHNPKLHSCADIDNYTPEQSANEAGCMQVLEEYIYVEVIDYGADGIILVVGHKDIKTDTKELVIKLMDLHEKKKQSDNEIRRLCTIDNLLGDPKSEKWRHLYSRTFGWTRCNFIPIVWQNGINVYILQNKNNRRPMPQIDIKKGVYCLISDYCGPFKLANYKFTNQLECQGFLFELIYGLAQAYYAGSFKHNDLHLGNIMVFAAPRRFQDRDYILHGRPFLVHGSVYPKIIDFGKATFYSDEKEYGREFDGAESGLEQLLTMMGEYAQPLLEITVNSDYDTFKQVLECSYFAHLRIRANIERPIGERCVTCYGPATQKCEHAPSYKFCASEACVRYMGPILQIAKNEV